MRKTALILGILITLMSVNIQAANAVQNTSLFIAPNGNDQNPGTIEAPFKTLEGARDYIRNLKDTKGMPEGGITVYLREGDYTLSKTLELDSRDSGTSDAQITYTSYNDEEVRILGGVKADKFEKISDSEKIKRLNPDVVDNVYVTDLSVYGVESVSELECFGQSAGTPEFSSVQGFKNGEFMELSRYPNDGYLTVESVLNPGKLNSEFSEDMANPAHEKPEFTYKYDGAKNWKDTDDLWVFAYLAYDWADLFAKIDEINTQTGTIKLYHASPYAAAEGRKFYFVNVFEELDSENEFYIDRQENKLYVISDDIQNDVYELALLEGDLVKVTNASYINFENLTFSLCRAIDINVIDSSNINIRNCEISENGKTAVSYVNSSDSEIKNNHIHTLGAKGVDVICGDTVELIPANIRIENNDIHDFGLVEKTYRAGISIEGCGNYAAHNEIYNATHYGISYGGHMNIFEYNDVHDCLLMAEDSGAVYTGRTWLCSGNTFRYNYFHDIPMNTGGTWKNNAVYLDDGMLGTEIYSNVFKDVQVGVFLHGGRYTTIENNIFIDCMESVSIINIYNPSHITDSMLPAAKEVTDNNPYFNAILPEVLESVNDTEPTLPKNNKVISNIMFNTPEPTLSEDALNYGVLENNISVTDESIFVDFENGNYTIDKSSAINKLIPDYKWFDFTQIGIVE